MAKPIRCPNPTCQHEFPAAAAAGVAALICPKCGGVFQRSAPPAPSPVPPVPSGPSSTRRFPILPVLGAVAVIIGAGAIIAARNIIQARNALSERSLPTPAEPFRSAQFNYSFLIPGAPWQQVSNLSDPAFVIALN